MNVGDRVIVIGNFNLYKGFEGIIIGLLEYDKCLELLLDNGLHVILKQSDVKIKKGINV